MKNERESDYLVLLFVAFSYFSQFLTVYLLFRVTCDKSAVGLFESGEYRYVACKSDQQQSKAGKQKDLGSNPLWLSFLFKNCGLWTLSCDFVPQNY